MKVTKSHWFVFVFLFVLHLSVWRIWPGENPTSLGRDILASLTFAALLSLILGLTSRESNFRGKDRPMAPTGKPTPHRY